VKIDTSNASALNGNNANRVKLITATKANFFFFFFFFSTFRPLQQTSTMVCCQSYWARQEIDAAGRVGSTLQKILFFLTVRHHFVTVVTTEEKK
jgi:hypothetical protein